MEIAVNQRSYGFTLVEIMIVVAIIGLLAAVAVPNFVKARTTSQTKACIKNLQMIDGAKETWALETQRGANGPVIESEVNTYIKKGAPICPAGGVYAYHDLGTAPTCTIAGHVVPENAGRTGGGGTASGGSGSGSGGGDNSGPGNTNP